MNTATLEETTRTAVFQVRDYCCDVWFYEKYLDSTAEFNNRHSLDCPVTLVFRRLECEEPVAILNHVEGEPGDKIHIWKESLPLTRLDAEHRLQSQMGKTRVPLLPSTIPTKELLGTADGRIGIVTPEIIQGFNLGVMEAAMRYRFNNYQRDGEPECRYAIAPIESNGNRFAYSEPAPAPMFYQSDNVISADAISPRFQEIRLDKIIHKFNGGLIQCAVLPNGRWAIYDPEGYGTFQEGHK